MSNYLKRHSIVAYFVFAIVFSWSIYIPLVLQDRKFTPTGELFFDVDRRARRAALDVKLLPAARGRGIATAALAWLVDLVFESEPDVELVWTEPWPDNEAAQRLYARCGLTPRPRPKGLSPGPSFWALSRGDRGPG